MIKQIGNLIRTKRLDQKMTIEQLAEKAELSASFIAKFERNDQNNISIQALEKIVNALNMKLGDLFMYEGISDTTTLELIGYLSQLSETDQQELSAAILKMIKISQKNSKQEKSFEPTSVDLIANLCQNNKDYKQKKDDINEAIGNGYLESSGECGAT